MSDSRLTSLDASFLEVESPTAHMHVGWAAVVATLAGLAEQESGLASALNNAAFQIGGAMGAAVLTSVAVSSADGVDSLFALTEGFQSAFVAAAVFPALGLVCAILLHGKPRGPLRLTSELARTPTPTGSRGGGGG